MSLVPRGGTGGHMSLTSLTLSTGCTILLHIGSVVGIPPCMDSMQGVWYCWVSSTVF